MMEVVTGGRSDGEGESGEKPAILLPLVFKAPHVSNSEFSPCVDSLGDSLLGFGDVLVPGIFVAFARFYDLSCPRKTNMHYITAFIGMMRSKVFSLTLLHIGLCRRWRLQKH